MPAPFAAELAGYRKTGHPNASDKNDKGSIRIGEALFDVMGVPRTQPGPGDAGKALEEAVKLHLRTLRPDLLIERGQSALSFEQYAHLSVFPTFRKEHRPAEGLLAKVVQAIGCVPDQKTQAKLKKSLDAALANLRRQDELVVELLAQMPEESLLKVDVTVGESRGQALVPLLQVALSSKWSLRTDRAQDCVSQGSKLVALRRGRMPHFAVVTMEPRPAMLKILGDGSGSVDCIYHVNLPALKEAMTDLQSQQRNPETWSPGRTFRRLLRQNRLRDYDDLVAEVRRVPSAATPPSGAAIAASAVGDLDALVDELDDPNQEDVDG